jgi:hypothetical protein
VRAAYADTGSCGSGLLPRCLRCLWTLPGAHEVDVNVHPTHGPRFVFRKRHGVRSLMLGAPPRRFGIAAGTAAPRTVGGTANGSPPLAQSPVTAKPPPAQIFRWPRRRRALERQRLIRAPRRTPRLQPCKRRSMARVAPSARFGALLTSRRAAERPSRRFAPWGRRAIVKLHVDPYKSSRKPAIAVDYRRSALPPSSGCFTNYASRPSLPRRGVAAAGTI